jgi:hypothetical protein
VTLETRERVCFDTKTSFARPIELDRIAPIASRASNDASFRYTHDAVVMDVSTTRRGGHGNI